MTKTDVAKNVVSFAVGMGTGKVVREIIKNNTEPDKVVDKAAVVVASYVLGAIVADIAKAWTDAKIDEIVFWWNKNVKDQLPSS